MVPPLYICPGNVTGYTTEGAFVSCSRAVLPRLSLNLSLFYGLQPFLSSISPKVFLLNPNKFYVTGNIFLLFFLFTRDIISAEKARQERYSHEQKSHDLRHRPGSRGFHRHGHPRRPPGSSCEGSNPPEGAADHRRPCLYAQRLRPEPGRRRQPYPGRGTPRGIQPVFQPDL